MSSTKTALITGITGQDGAYLARLLLGKGYEVYGGARRNSNLDIARLVELGVEKDVKIIDLEMLELSNLMRALEKVKPAEIYNLAAQSFVGASFELPIYTVEVDAVGALRLLEATRTVCPSARFYQASTSEMFGKVNAVPQVETTPFHPRSPYGVAKVCAHWATVNYREAWGLHASSGILFNHESPLRGRDFVTRKITMTLAKVHHKQQECVYLGNLDARRDWGFAGDYVEAMWLMLQQEMADDYVIATGETHSVRDFVTASAYRLGMKIEWEGTGRHERGIDTVTNRTIVKVDERFFRPAEVELLIGMPEKARSHLGWTRKTSFEALVNMMTDADERRAATNVFSF